MFTAPSPVNIEFETSQKKIDSLATGCVVLSAGNSAYGYEIIATALASLAGAQQPLMAVVADRVKDSFVTVRLAKIREQIIVPFLRPDFVRIEATGKTLPEYLASQGQLYGNLVNMMNGFNLNSDFIVTGVDNGGARICVITHPGTVIWLDKLGYTAIGSGGIHANMRLAVGAQTRDSPLVETVYRVYDAKRASEVAPGVGPQTDMAIVSAHGTKTLTPEVLATLSTIFNESQGSTPDTLDPLAGMLAEGGGR